MKTNIGIRILNFFLDSFFVNVIVSTITIIFIKILNVRLSFFLTFGIVWFLYYFIFESIFERTLGKIITKSKVVLIEDRKKKYGYILVRTISRLIPFEPLSIFFNSDYIMWHDKLSKTRVINNKSLDDI